MTLRDRIRELAKSEGMSLPVLESKLGFGNGTIVRWDKSSPTAEKLQKVADYFNVTTDYLLGRDENKNSPAETAEDDFQFALLNGTKDLSEEGKKELLAYKDYLFHKYIKK